VCHIIASFGFCAWVGATWRFGAVYRAVTFAVTWGTKMCSAALCVLPPSHRVTTALPAFLLYIHHVLLLQLAADASFSLVRAAGSVPAACD
jgi:hypothetical protein